MDLENVKVGDVLAHIDWSDVMKRQVVRVLATQIVTEDGSRFKRRRARGTAHGYGQVTGFIEPWDEARHPAMQAETEERKRLEEAEEEDRKECLRVRALIGARLHDLSLDQLRRIAAITKEPQP